MGRASTPFAEVEVRDLAVYDTLLRPVAGDTDIAAPHPIAAPGGAERLALEPATARDESLALMPSGAGS
jgi:hypothetical protein